MVTDERLRQLIAEELPSLIELRHDLHENPELGYEETRTSQVVRRELGRAGIEFVGDLAGGTGVLGYLPGSMETAIGLRADMDALPIEEVSDVEYKSKTAGVMHACGHDGHTTMLIGAARILAKIAAESELPRPVKFVFQPAEEVGAGAKRMVDDGVLGGDVLGPPIDTMFGLHGWPLWPLGVVGTRPGPLLAAADTFDIDVLGTGAHAAFPHLGRDPIVASSAIVSALQTLASREVDPLDAVVVSVTRFDAGSAYNVIPDRAALAGTIRTLQSSTREHLIRRIESIAHQVAHAYGCESSVTISDGYPVTNNDANAASRFEDTARETLGDERVRPVELPVMGTEDFSFYSHEVPSCFFVLGLIPAGQQGTAQLHQATFDFNDDAIPTGIELSCHLAIS